MRETQSLLNVSIIPKGDWKANAYYDRLSLVRHKEATYLAYSPSVGIEPGLSTGWETYWMLLVKDTDFPDANELYEEATSAVYSIQNMTVSLVELEPSADAYVEKTVDPETGTLNIEFGLPIARGADVTLDTVTPDVLFLGYTAHNKKAELITGTYVPDASTTNYVVGNPVNFTLLASEWNGTTYNLDLSAYPAVSNNIVIGIPTTSSMYNATLMANAALSIAQVSISRNSETQELTSATARISAVNQPTEDLLVAIWGLA